MSGSHGDAPGHSFGVDGVGKGVGTVAAGRLGWVFHLDAADKVYAVGRILNGVLVGPGPADECGNTLSNWFILSK